MASKTSKLDHLARVPLFEGCSRKELTSIAKAGDEITMTQGTLIIDQGQMGREAFVVLDGQVTVKRGKGGGGFLKKIFGGGASALSVKFQEHSTTATTSMHRSLSLAKLRPGDYTLEVTITDAAGRTDKRSEPFEVVP